MSHPLAPVAPRCIGCSRTTDVVCDRCLVMVIRGGVEMLGQLERLIQRGIPVPQATAMMERRIDRYFKNGTLSPLAKLAMD